MDQIQQSESKIKELRESMQTTLSGEDVFAKRRALKLLFAEFDEGTGALNEQQFAGAVHAIMPDTPDTTFEKFLKNFSTSQDEVFKVDLQGFLKWWGDDVYSPQNVVRQMPTLRKSPKEEIAANRLLEASNDAASGDISPRRKLIQGARIFKRSSTFKLQEALDGVDELASDIKRSLARDKGSSADSKSSFRRHTLGRHSCVEKEARLPYTSAMSQLPEKMFQNSQRLRALLRGDKTDALQIPADGTPSRKPRIKTPSPPIFDQPATSRTGYSRHRIASAREARKPKAKRRGLEEKLKALENKLKGER